MWPNKEMSIMTMINRKRCKNSIKIKLYKAMFIRFFVVLKLKTNIQSNWRYIYLLQTYYQVCKETGYFQNNI